jgi:uncharacterized membrane-anchored protein YhcB (DUF1043 family)
MKDREDSMNTKYMKYQHIYQVLSAIEQKITSNQLVKELITDNEVAGYKISNDILIYKIGMNLVTFDALKLNIEDFFDNNHDLLRQMVQDLQILFYLLSEDIISRKKMQEFLDKIDRADKDGEEE